jgi:NAD(P)-dependent dehydrogenase (short-subunit alcohol dehydrogenase family)
LSRHRPGDRCFAASESVQFFALVSSFSVSFDGFDKSGALIFNNAPSRALLDFQELAKANGALGLKILRFPPELNKSFRISIAHPILSLISFSRIFGGGLDRGGRMAQVWLVTGSSRGLGRAIVEAGLAAGNKVLATARDIKSLADLSERYGDQVKLFAMDVTDEAAAANAVMAAVDVFGSLDVVINNAGYGNLSSVEDTPLSEFRAQIETNLFGTIIVTKAALRYFREKKAGQFIQFSSVGGRIGPPGRGPYSAAKWGVEGFSEVLSREVAPLGIKVTIVEPGGFRTDFAGSSTELSEGHPEYDSTVGATARFQRNYNGKQPGDPKKAAQAIVQLTQERNPPLRLLLGSDAYTAAEKNDLARLEEARIWKKLSVSTDFETK